MVSPPWKRDNPQTPTYRPPHYENLPSTAESTPRKQRASAIAAAGAGEMERQEYTLPPPRPQKLTPRDSQSNIAQQHQAAATPSAAGAQPVQSQQAQQASKEAFNPQKWRDQLQAKKNYSRKLNDPLIFQYPTPYRAPDWLKVYSPKTLKIPHSQP